MFAAVLLAITLATLNLVAIWAVLGAGWWPARLLGLLAIPLAIAAGLHFYGNYLFTKYGGLPNTPMIDSFIRMRTEWYAWLWVNAALLAAMLLFLRASGYQLARTARADARPDSPLAA
jgi:hypothetical protein